MEKRYIIKRVGLNEYITIDEEVSEKIITDDILDAMVFSEERLAEKVLFAIEDTPFENGLEDMAFEIIKIYRN
jgi:hypothetical protein